MSIGNRHPRNQCQTNWMVIGETAYFLESFGKPTNTLWERGKAFLSVALSKPNRKKMRMTQIALIMLPQHLKTSLQGAKSEGVRRRFAEPSATPVAAPSIMARRGREWVPRRMYLLPCDFAAKGCTPGCPGCTWLQNRLGARRGHTDACRERVEAEISSDSQHAE